MTRVAQLAIALFWIIVSACMRNFALIQNWALKTVAGWRVLLDSSTNWHSMTTCHTPFLQHRFIPWTDVSKLRQCWLSTSQSLRCIAAHLSLTAILRVTTESPALENLFQSLSSVCNASSSSDAKLISTTSVSGPIVVPLLQPLSLAMVWDRVKTFPTRQWLIGSRCDIESPVSSLLATSRDSILCSTEPDNPQCSCPSSVNVEFLLLRPPFSGVLLKKYSVNGLLKAF